MVFASADRRAPDWSLPALPRENWGAARWKTLRLVGHVQDVAENGVDFKHFESVHRYSNLRQPIVEVEGQKLHSRFGFDRDNPLSKHLGTVSAIFDTDIWGLGCSITSLHALGMHFRLLLLATQINARSFDFSIGISVERLPQLLAQPILSFMMRTIIGDVLQDREIWAHRRHLERPALTAEDAPLVEFRRYAERFYPAPAGGLALRAQ